MNKNKYRFSLSRFFSFGRTSVTGNVVGVTRETKQIQEHLETIYYIGWVRVIVYHSFKFTKYD